MYKGSKSTANIPTEYPIFSIKYDFYHKRPYLEAKQKINHGIPAPIVTYNVALKNFNSISLSFALVLTCKFFAAITNDGIKQAKSYSLAAVLNYLRNF